MLRGVSGVCTLLLLIEASLAAATSLASSFASYTRNPFFFPCGYARRTSYGWRQCRPCCGPCCLTTRLRRASEQEVRFPSLSTSMPALLCTRRKQRILEFFSRCWSTFTVLSFVAFVVSQLISLTFLCWFWCLKCVEEAREDEEASWSEGRGKEEGKDEGSQIVPITEKVSMKN